MAVSNGLPSRQDVKAAFAQLNHIVRTTPQSESRKWLSSEGNAGLLDGLKTQLHNAATIGDVLWHAFGRPVDDRDYVMESVIQLAAQLPLASSRERTVTDSFLAELWNDLKHPPLSSLGEQFTYRKADGSNNNVLWPRVGAAGSSYARTVKPKSMQPIALPDPGVLFDSIMARRDFKEHPNKISSVLFYLASIITHDLFKTNPNDFTISDTSSYLDLSPLYGSNQEDQDLMRTLKDGKIKPDCFSDQRLLTLPPGVGVLLIMFGRFHNHVVEKLAIIDENGRFSSIRRPRGQPASNESEVKYDNALFQTGRLITCGLYVQIILRDYVRTILNLNRTNSKWDLDPRSEDGKTLFGQVAAEASGNQVSAEFNIVYRWHSCISKRDEEWAKQAYRVMFPDSNSSSPSQTIKKLSDWSKSLPKDPQERPFHNLHRKPTGAFEDDELAAIFAASVEDPAGAFGARHIPEVLRDVEILGIIQARSWNLSSLNEFREHFKLLPHKTFEDINPDPYVAEQLRRLYDHPNHVELYPGLVAEDAKHALTPGSGLCPGFTISRAVLSDAVALVRGDRFYTVDYTPKNLTNWGYNEVDYDLSVDNGHAFYKLVLGVFPRYFQPDSIYAHYPLVCPDENQNILKRLDTVQLYSFQKPCALQETATVESHAACKAVLDAGGRFSILPGFDLFVEEKKDTQQYHIQECTSILIRRALLEIRQQEVKLFYQDISSKFLQHNKYQIAGVNQIDLVKDVIIPAQVHFVSSVFSLPLKTEHNPHGIYSESEMYAVMSLIAKCIFQEVDPTAAFPLHQAARMLTEQLGKLVELNVRSVNPAGFVANILYKLYHHDALTDHGVHLIQHLLRSNLSARDIVFVHILPAAAEMVAIQSMLICQCLEYYLSEGQAHLSKIQKLAMQDSSNSDDILLHYALEGTRLRSSMGIYREVAKAGKIDDDGIGIPLQIGQRVFCNLISASRDPKVFPHPDKVDLTRDADSYIHLGMGTVGKEVSRAGLIAVLRTVGRLNNLRHVPGPQGECKKVTSPSGSVLYMTEDHRSFTPFPGSLKINWDGNMPTVP